MSSIRGKRNKTTEYILRMALVRHGIRGWILHPKYVPGCPDFFFPQKNIAVFVDGCFWHGCSRCGHIPLTNRPFWSAKIKRNRNRDLTNAKVLRKAGIRVLRFWEHELRESLGKCLGRIRLIR